MKVSSQVSNNISTQFNKKKYNRILLVQLRQLGDILLTTPVLTALRRALPECEVSFLTHRMGRLILTDHPAMNGQLMTYTESDTWRQNIELFQKIRKMQFDAVCDFMNNPRSALFSLLSGAPERLGFESVRRLAYSRVSPRGKSSEYIVTTKLRMLDLLGIQGIQGIQAADFSADGTAGLPPIVPWHESDSKVVRQWFDGVPKKSFNIILSPTHRRRERRWPPELFAKLADYLVNQYEANIVWLWGPGEELLIDQCMALCQRKTLKAPKTTFREMACLITNCSFFIGNSNGPSHVAVASGTPSLQLHGPTDGRSWCPNTSKHLFCQGNLISEISLTSVISKIETMLPVILEEQLKKQQHDIITKYPCDVSI